jgi:hypothetical protein
MELLAIVVGAVSAVGGANWMRITRYVVAAAIICKYKYFRL